MTYTRTRNSAEAPYPSVDSRVTGQEYRNGEHSVGGSQIPPVRIRSGVAWIEELGGSANWVTWGILGSAVAALASFRPLIHQTGDTMMVQLQIKSSVSHGSLFMAIVIVGLMLLDRHQPRFQVSAAVASLAISLAMLSLYVLLTAAGLVGFNENAGLGIGERLTWLPSTGMLFSAAGYAAVVVAAVLAFLHRPAGGSPER